MIGSFPIGTVPVGSNQLAGFQIGVLGIADSSADGLLMNMRLGIGQASAQSDGLLAIPKTLLELGISDSTAESINVIPKTLSDLILANLTADANGLGMALSLGQGSATAQGLIGIPKVYLQVGQALSTAQGIDFKGLGIGLLRVDLNAQPERPGLGIPLVIKDSTAQALDLVGLMKPELGQATATIDANSFNPVYIELFDGDMVATALDASASYLITEIPEIVVTRTSTQAVLKVLNKNQNNLRIFRADDHRGAFSVVQSNWDDATDYTDSGLDETKNYKYVACFVVVGTRGGVEYIVTGQRCLPVYTIGNQLL